MLTLPLEPTDDRATPAFKDRAGCTQWLGQLQLTNLQQAQHALRSQLDELNRYPMRALERMQVLELLGETVAHVQHDFARRLVAKALPLNTAELAVLESLAALWQGMVTGYQRCLQSYVAGDRQVAAHGALFCHRCLHYCGRQILEYLQAGYEFDGALWQQLHTLYAFAEEQELHLLEVDNEPATGIAGQSHCRTVYLKLLLICHAHPFELSRNQLNLLDRWLTKWQDSLSLERHCTRSRGEAQPLAVDFDSSLGLQPLSQDATGRLRYLPMVPLSKLLRVKTILLQQGQSPQQLELEGCGKAEDCAEFLTMLHRNWCETPSERRVLRSSAGQEVHACYELESIYSHITQKPFRSKRRSDSSINMARSQIATFGRTLSDTGKHHDLAALGYPRETWTVDSGNLLGALLVREEEAEARLATKQLIATFVDDTNCTLATVNWLDVDRTGRLHASIRYLPGAPEAVLATTQEVSGAAALLLPPMPDLRIPASLILPRNQFQPGGQLELTLRDGKKKKIKMGISVEKGGNYERISFSEV